MSEAGCDIGRDKFGQITAECRGDRRIDVPRERLQHGVFHGHDVFGKEVAAADPNEGGNLKFTRFEELAGEVEGGHGGQLEDTSVHCALGNVSVQITHGNVDHLTVVVKMIHNLVAPLTYLLTPKVQLRHPNIEVWPYIGVRKINGTAFGCFLHQASLPFWCQVVWNHVVSGSLFASHVLEALANLIVLCCSEGGGLRDNHGYIWRIMGSLATVVLWKTWMAGGRRRRAAGMVHGAWVIRHQKIWRPRPKVAGSAPRGSRRTHGSLKGIVFEKVNNLTKY